MSRKKIAIPATNEPLEASWEVPQRSKPTASQKLTQHATKARGFAAKHRPSHRLIIRLVIASGIMVAGLALISPLSYPIYGTVIKRDVLLYPQDTSFQLNIKNAQILIDGQPLPAQTDYPIRLSKLGAGTHTVQINAPHYHPVSTTITISPYRSSTQDVFIGMEPDGRPILATVNDSITDQPVKNAIVAIGETEYLTDEKGQATVVLPVTTKNPPVKISKDGYDTRSTTLSESGKPLISKLPITPTGSLHYFSNATGTVNLMSARLDGSEPTIVLPGTGFELPTTQLSTSPNGEWLAFVSNRDGQRDGRGILTQRVFCLNAQSGQLITLPDTDASFSIAGWTSTNQLVYRSENIYATNTTAGRYQLRLYNPADNGNQAIYTSRAIPANYLAGYEDKERYFGIVEDMYGKIFIRDGYIVYSFRRSPYPGNGWGAAVTTRIIIADESGKTLHQVINADTADIDLNYSGQATVWYARYVASQKFYAIDLVTGDERIVDQPPETVTQTAVTADKSLSAKTIGAGLDSKVVYTDQAGQVVHEMPNPLGLQPWRWATNRHLLLVGGADIYVASPLGGTPKKIGQSMNSIVL